MSTYAAKMELVLSAEEVKKAVKDAVVAEGRKTTLAGSSLPLFSSVFESCGGELEGLLLKVESGEEWVKEVEGGQVSAFSRRNMSHLSAPEDPNKYALPVLVVVFVEADTLPSFTARRDSPHHGFVGQDLIPGCVRALCVQGKTPKEAIEQV